MKGDVNDASDNVESEGGMNIASTNYLTINKN